MTQELNQSLAALTLVFMLLLFGCQQVQPCVAECISRVRHTHAGVTFQTLFEGDVGVDKSGHNDQEA